MSEPSGEGRTEQTGINEDWAATIVGLVLLILVLAGVITKSVIP